MYIDSGHVSHEVLLRLKMEDFLLFWSIPKRYSAPIIGFLIYAVHL